EKQIASGPGELLGIAVEVARISLEVLAGAELHRVDENRRDDHVAGRACDGHERKMSGVQRTHRRNEADAHTACPPRGDARPERRLVAHELHATLRIRARRADNGGCGPPWRMPRSRRAPCRPPARIARRSAAPGPR